MSLDLDIIAPAIEIALAGYIEEWQGDCPYRVMAIQKGGAWSASARHRCYYEKSWRTIPTNIIYHQRIEPTKGNQIR